MPSLVALLILFSAVTGAAQTVQSLSEPPQPGTIMGTVTNNDGDPIEGATVCTSFKTGPRGSSASCGVAHSDKDGRFEVHTPLGEVGVYAEKQEGGYWQVIDHSPAHSKGIRRVILTADTPTAEVRLKVGPRPGELKFDVKDKSTGKPIDWFGVRWIALDDVRMFSMDSQRRRALIPPDTDVMIEVHATGYKRWFFIDPANPSQPTLRLEPGEVRELQVELEPLAKN